MTGNNDDEREPGCLYIGARLGSIVLMVIGAVVLSPWDNPNPLVLLFSVFYFGIGIHNFIYPWKYGGDGADY